MPTEYGVRPYTNTKDELGREVPYVETMKAPTWAYALAQEVQKFSEFMKPYLADGDYPDMENNWPGYSFPQPDGGVDTGDYNPGVPGCIVTCNSPLYCDDPVECHASISNCPPGLGPAECRLNFQFQVFLNGARYNNWTYFSEVLQTQTSSELGVNLNYFVTPGTNINPLQIYPPLSTGEWSASPADKVSVIMTDPAGNKCRTTETVFCRSVDCCTASDYIAMTFDNASTPDTIARGGSIAVYVLNGCPPYSWASSQAAYTFATPTTTILSNTLSLTADACSSNSYTTVTVTDSCGTVVTANILSTDGYWAACEVSSGPCGFPYNPPCDADYLYDYFPGSDICLFALRCCTDEAPNGPGEDTTFVGGPWWCTPCLGLVYHRRDLCPHNGCAHISYGWRC